MTAAILRRAAFRQGIDGERILLAIVAFYVLAFCLVPLVRLFGEAVLPGGGIGSEVIGRLLASRAARVATWNTIEASLVSAVLSLVLGTAMALVIGLTDVRARTVLVFLMLLPMLIPAQITALAWIEFLGPTSPILKPFGYALAPGQRNPLYSREGIVLLMGIEHGTIVFLAVRAGLRAIPRDLVEAAQAAGARPWRVVLGVVIPLLRPAMVAGTALAFVSSIGNFGIPALLGIPGRYTMLTTLIYQRLNGFGPSALGEVAALGLVLAGLAAAGLLVQAMATHRQSVRVERVGGAVRPFALGRWRGAVEGATWGVLLVIAVLPLLALAGTSLSRAIGVPLDIDTATLAHYRYALFGHDGTQRAFANSLGLALVAATVTTLISIPFAYFVVSRRRVLARILDSIADAPYALPGIVLSIACILVFLKPLPLVGIGLYNTIWIILIAYFGRFLALALRPTAAGLQQFEPTLEEAAQISGAGSLRRLVTIVTPLVAPAAAAGGILVFMSAFNELTVSALLWSTGNETLGVVVFLLHDEGNSTAAAAVAMLSVIATLAIALATTAFARRLPQGALPWRE